MKHRPWWYLPVAAGLSVVSGLLCALALPPRDISWLGWVALVPLLISSRFVGPFYSALCGGLAAGMAVRVLVGPSKVPMEAANASFIFLVLALAFASVSALASFTSRRLSPRLWAVFVACAGVTLEMATMPFAPASVALTQHSSRYALGLVSYTGIWGVSFFIWLVSASVAGLSDKRKSTWPLLVITALVLGYYGLRGNIATIASASDVPAVRVSAIQAPGEYNAAEETAKLAGESLAVLWPEQCLPSEAKMPYESAKQRKTYLVASIIEPAGKGKPYNRCRIISPKGKNVGSFRKTHLYGSEVRYYTPGKGSRPVDCGKFKAGVAICFDSFFPGVCRKLAREGANIIFVPSFDPEMPGSAANRLHGAMNQIRSAENDIPIAWADANSLSTIFDRGGRIIARAPERQITSITGNVHLKTRTTFYTRHGDWLAWLCVVGTLALLVLAIVRGPRKDG